MSDAKPMQTPLSTNSSLSLHSSTSLSDPSNIRAIVGSLQYLLLTHLDIAFVVNKLSQYMHKPNTEHWALVKHLLRYGQPCLWAKKGISVIWESRGTFVIMGEKGTLVILLRR
ncbi:hypothetical protein Patl1_15705 [Pistacia atlantica]|uniref:Uncharacterized protein n=1 Tax=Pistacia atlantica TaxID=434234 RepID=A0ACC1B7B2_9ROSI|nr:hypothetical protein Patl1_15705 [Pistacia atlantica]